MKRRLPRWSQTSARTTPVERPDFIQITPDHERVYRRRLADHRSLVQQFAATLAHYDPQLAALPAQARDHDQTKLVAPEYDGFLLAMLTASKARTPDQTRIIDAARQFHRHHQPHHLEHWAHRTPMPDLALAEAIADWAARAIDTGTRLRPYINSVILPQPHWSDRQRDRIIDLAAATGLE
jgi:Family of unknown function (DUF5662)